MLLGILVCSCNLSSNYNQVYTYVSNQSISYGKSSDMACSPVVSWLWKSTFTLNLLQGLSWHTERLLMQCALHLLRHNGSAILCNLCNSLACRVVFPDVLALKNFNYHSTTVVQSNHQSPSANIYLRLWSTCLRNLNIMLYFTISP